MAGEAIMFTIPSRVAATRVEGRGTEPAPPHPQTRITAKAIKLLTTPNRTSTLPPPAIKPGTIQYGK